MQRRLLEEVHLVHEDIVLDEQLDDILVAVEGRTMESSPTIAAPGVERHASRDALLHFRYVAHGGCGMVGTDQPTRPLASPPRRPEQLQQLGYHRLAPPGLLPCSRVVELSSQPRPEPDGVIGRVEETLGRRYIPALG